MPALKPTDIVGRVVWLGSVPDRSAALASEALQELQLSFSGPEGEDHAGLTRPSCSRVVSQHRRGTEIRNTRQLSIVGAEEVAQISADLGIQDFDPAWIGATMVIEGIPDFSHLPPSARLQAPSGATVIVDMQNRPCHLPAPVIEAACPGKGKVFKEVAKGKRGVTASVERPGVVCLGDAISLHVPDQRPWLGLSEQ